MELLAKSNGETLLQHTQKCIEFGNLIVDGLPVDEEKRRLYSELVAFCCAFHDLGKACSGFQEALRNEGQRWGRKRHEIISAYLSSQLGLSEEQIFAIITHHRDIIGGVASNKKVLPYEQICQDDGDTGLLKEMKKEFAENLPEFKVFFQQLCLLLDRTNLIPNIPEVLGEGIGISDSWLIGDEDAYGQKRVLPVERRKMAAELRAILKAADHLSSGDIKPIQQIKLNQFQISCYKQRGFQKRCEDTQQSIILKAPTGSGKTEALLYWSKANQSRNGRLFYILPYQASINAMYNRLSGIFGHTNVGILHSNSIAYLYELQKDVAELTKQEAQKLSKVKAQLAREMYYPIRVCTPHQLLRLGLKGKGWEYLFLETQNACIVFDEIHTFEPRIVGFIVSLARFLKKSGCKFAFASATLPRFLEEIIIEHLKEVDIITLNKKDMSDREVLSKARHRVTVRDGNIVDNLELVVNEVNKGKKVLIIANHVKTAQHLYSLLEGFKPCLLHGRFNRLDRVQKEQKITGNNPPKVVIATQVIEVSLDIDYEVMFTEPAPIDALAQRFGRVNRKGERKPENITVFNEQVSIHKLYDEERVKRTVNLLENVNNPMSEDDLVKITDEVYREGYVGEELKEFRNGFEFEDINFFDKNFVAGTSRDWVEDIITRTDQNIEVLPIEYHSQYTDKMDEGLWIEANSLLVPCKHTYKLKQAVRFDEKHKVYVANCQYDRNIGLNIDGKPSNFL